jgi:hypothetical protein
MVCKATRRIILYILKKVADKAILAGHDVKIRQLSGLYTGICTYSKDDLQLDCGGTPG